MNRIICLSVMLFLPLAPLMAGQSQDLNEIRVLAEKTVLELFPDKEISVKSIHLDQRLRLARCNGDLSAETPANTPASANITVGIRCHGVQPWFLYVPVEIQEFDSVVSIARNIAAGEIITPAAVQLTRMDIRKLSGAYFTSVEDVAGMEMIQPARKDMLLLKHMLKRPILIERGQLVTVISRNPAFSVRIQATALAAAAVGERIRLKNNRSRRIIEGVVSADSTVFID